MNQLKSYLMMPGITAKLAKSVGKLAEDYTGVGRGVGC